MYVDILRNELMYTFKGTSKTGSVAPIVFWLLQFFLVKSIISLSSLPVVKDEIIEMSLSDHGSWMLRVLFLYS